MPVDKRLSFRSELMKNVDKQHLHDEVLVEQAVLDYQTYREIMGLIHLYSRELQDMQNEACFTQRIELLREGNTNEYNKIIKELSEYN